MVFISTILSPSHIMFMCLLIILSGCLVAVTLGGTYYYALVATAVLLGLGNSSILCTAYMWLKSHDLPVYGRVVATLTLSASLGSELLPALVGQYIEDDPLFLMWFLLASIVSASLIMLIMTSCIGIREYWRKMTAQNNFDYKILAAMEEESKESEEAMRRFLDDY